MEAVQEQGFAFGGSVARLSALSVGLWGIGVLSVHFAAPHGAFTPRFAAVLLLATIPMAWLTVRLAVRTSGLTPARIMETAALVSMPALLLDGLALTWVPAFYSIDPGEQRAAAAWLLWFVGVSLAVAICTRAYLQTSERK
jgi:hypothetical protein